jgi:peptidoglycan/xylan/chitin deacetylase (PgdA/CDA1 family)
VLKKKQMRAGFFLTGNFYSNPSFEELVRSLHEDGHYLGAHSDKHLLYADWEERDSMLVTRREFKKDLRKNYRRMAKYGIKTDQATLFLPPYEWYNKAIAAWTRELGLYLVNYTPGTLSTADYTYPEMGVRYRSTGSIYESIMKYESTDKAGLNGFILLIHIGTDPRRSDKFYSRLEELLTELHHMGYRFVRIDELLEQSTSE